MLQNKHVYYFMIPVNKMPKLATYPLQSFTRNCSASLKKVFVACDFFFCRSCQQKRYCQVTDRANSKVNIITLGPAYIEFGYNVHRSKGLFTPSAIVKMGYIEFQLYHTHQASAAAAPLASKNQMGPRAIPSVFASDAPDARCGQALRGI